MDNGPAMVHLRLARKDNREEVPLHFEGHELALWARLGGWICGAATTGTGIIVMVKLAGTSADVGGALLASIGAVTLAAVIRCRRFETVIGKRWLKWRCGPFRSDVPTSLISKGASHASTGWRRLYAPREVIVDLETGQSGPTLPTADADELIHILIVGYNVGEGCDR